MIDPSRLERVTAAGGFVPTKSDTVADPKGPAIAGLYTITAGAVKFTDAMGTTHTLAAVPAFTRIPIAVSRVWLTGTVADCLILN